MFRDHFLSVELMLEIDERKVQNKNRIWKKELEMEEKQAQNEKKFEKICSKTIFINIK